MMFEVRLPPVGFSAVQEPTELTEEERKLRTLCKLAVRAVEEAKEKERLLRLQCMHRVRENERCWVKCVICGARLT